MQNYTGNRQSGMTGENPVFRSLAIIEERIQEKLTVKNLADSVHFSKYHYQRMFREAVGESVMGYVTRRRLSLAAGELAETKESVLDIALKYGYSSHEGFTRGFKAYMGITPTEYRKYHLSTGSLKMQKEKCAMKYSKATDEIIRELNALIVQAKETADYTGKNMGKDPEALAYYARFWEFLASGTEAMAEELRQNLDRIMDIPKRPDEISARLLVIKAMEDAAFWSGIAAFQAGLMTARAKPEHREAYLPICGRYEALAGNARIKAGKITGFLKELTALIFQDMRENAEQKLRDAVEKGRAAVKDLSDGQELPYGYIADEIQEMTDRLSSLPLEEFTVSFLEEELFRLDIVIFTADVDALRSPSHQPLFDGIRVFREKLCEAAEFFQGLPTDAARLSPEAGAGCAAPDKRRSELAFRGNILLFCLKGEIQKLGDSRLDGEQKAAFGDICDKMASALRLAEDDGTADNTGIAEDGITQITKILRKVYDELTLQAKKLGMYGAPVQYIAEELKRLTPEK